MVATRPRFTGTLGMQVGIILTGSLACILFGRAIGSAYAQPDHRGRGIMLELGYYVSGEMTTAAFSITNENREPFHTTPLCTNYNRLVIVTPDGKRVERFSWKDGIPPVVIEGGGSQVWSLNLAEIPELKAAGTYRMTWKVGELESGEIVVVRPAGKVEGE